MRFAVLLVCALLCVPGGARAVAVNEAHPRVWITGATLPGIGEGICGLDSQRFDLPPPPASGTTGRWRRLLLSGRF